MSTVVQKLITTPIHLKKKQHNCTAIIQNVDLLNESNVIESKLSLSIYICDVQRSVLRR